MEIKAVMVINQIILDNTNEGKLQCFLFTFSSSVVYIFFMLCPFTFCMFQLLAY